MKKTATLAALLLYCAIAIANTFENQPKTKKGIVFSPNQGQVMDNTGKPMADVLATAKIPGLDLYITKTGLSYVLLKYEEDLQAQPHPVYVNEKKYKINYSRVDVALEGASLSANQLQFTDEASWQTNYYYGNNSKGHLGVHSYKTMTVKNVYPNIDWVWKSTADGRLEYDFIVHPGGNPALIKMQYKYADLIPQGDKLNISTRNGSITEGELKATCADAKVAIEYLHNKANNEISFELGNYDATKDLTIDPPLSLDWSAQYGGSFADALRGVATDISGNIVYMVGYTNSVDFPVINLAGATYFDGTHNGNSDAVILKANTKMDTILWTSYIGGAGSDYANTVAVDRTGKVYVAGMAATGFPIQALAGAYNQVGATGQDAFVCRFDTNLALDWSTMYGGGGTDEALRIHVSRDISNHVFVGGYTNSVYNTFPANTGGGYQQSTVNGIEGFLVRFDSLGVRKWASLIGGNGDDYITALTSTKAVSYIGSGQSDDVLTFAGFTSSTNLPVGTGNVMQSANAGNIDGFTAKISLSLNTLNDLSYYGGSNNDYITDIASQVSQHIVYTGRTNSTNFPVLALGTFTYNQSALAGDYDAFLFTTYMLSNAVLWSTYYGGSGTDGGTGIATGTNGNIYFTGFTFSNNFPLKTSISDTAAYQQNNNAGNSDGFVVKVSFLGKQLWSTFKGKNCYEYPLALSYNLNKNKFYVVGEGFFSCGTSVPGNTQVPPGGGADAFAWGFEGDGGGGSDSCFDAAVNVIPACVPYFPWADCNGTAFITVTGSNTPYNAYWPYTNTIGLNTDNICPIFGYGTSEVYLDAIVEDNNGCAQFISGIIPYSTQFDGLYYEEPLDCNDSVRVYPQVRAEGPYEIYWYVDNISAGQTIGINDANQYPYTDGSKMIQGTNVLRADILDAFGCNYVVDSLIYPYTPNHQFYYDSVPSCSDLSAILVSNSSLPPYLELEWITPPGPGTNLADWDTGLYIVNSKGCDPGQTFDSIYIYNDSFQIEITETGFGCPFYAGNATVIHNSTNEYVVWINDFTGEISNTGTLNDIYSETPYWVTLSNDYGCQVDSYYIAGSNTSVLNANSNVGTTTCTGNTATVQISATGGTSPYTGTGTFNLTPGTYIYEVSDNGGCADTVEFIVSPASGGITASYNAAPIVCNGTTTTVQVSATGGTLPYTGTGNFTATAGSYTYIVSDNGGCADTVNVTLTEPTAVAGSYTATPIPCAGGSSTIQLSAIGGTAPYTGTGNQVVPAGTYTYIVTDDAGCADTLAVTVTEPTAVAATYTTGTIVCYQGTTTVQVNATGGTLPYTGTGTYTAGDGNHMYIVTDNNGCVDTANVTLNQPPLLFTTYLADTIICNGGSTTLQVTGNGGVSPYTGTGTFTANASAQVYIVTDSLGCADTLNVTLAEPSAIISSYTVGTIACTGGTTTVDISAIGGIAPYTNTGTFAAAAGSHNYIITDNWGCTDTVNIVITEPTPVVASYAGNTTVECPGGETGLLINATGGTQPYTGTGSTFASIGNNTYIITDNEGCADTLSVVVNDIIPITVSASVAAPVNCSAGTIQVTIAATGGTGPYTGTGTITATANTEYHLTIQDANNCVYDTVVHIILPADTFSIATTADTFCIGDTVLITVNGNYNPVWLPGNTTGNSYTLNSIQAATTISASANTGNCYVYDTLTVHALPCTDDTVGMGNVMWGNAVNVYPNPTSGLFYVQFEQALQYETSLSLHTAEGRLVQMATMQQGEKTITIDCTQLASGVHILHLQQNGVSKYYKVVVDK